MIDYRRLLDRPEKSAQTAAERPIHNTHTHKYTHASRQSEDVETVESSPALTHSFALHGRRFITAMNAISLALAYTLQRKQFSALHSPCWVWMVGRRVREWSDSDSHTRRALLDWVVFFCSVFHALESVHSTHGNILHSIVFVILCKSDVCCWSYCGLPFVCVCVVSLAGCVSVCVWVFVKHSELKFKSMRWIISL